MARRSVSQVELVGGRDLVGDLLEQEELVDEPRVDRGGLEDLLGRRPGADRVHDGAQPAVVGARDFSSSAAASLDGLAAKSKTAPLLSSERSAFCSASVKLRPMAIASPTLFMWVVSVVSAPGNFSNANRGTLTTT